MRKQIAVVGPFSDTMREALSRAFSDEYFFFFIDDYKEYDKLQEADYVIIRTLELREEHIPLLKKCRMIQRWGAGYDSVDIKAAGKAGIAVAVTVGVNATAVSEMALALMLAVMRNVVAQSESIMSGDWKREMYSKRSYTLCEKTVGLIGIGNIGKKVAALCRAFGARVVYYDPFKLSDEQEKLIGVEYIDEEHLWSSCDIISLHSPLTDKTKNMVNADTLSKMNANAVLINTARSELVDLSALAEALREGKLLGAGLDAIEPTIVDDNPFAGLKNIVLTAHLGGNTVDNVTYMAQRCAEQITVIDRGGQLCFPHIVNLDYIKEMRQ